ncbi:glycine cleavage system aminomethyltransferase GcvT [Chelatococcus composti]|jgi:glycine cleavage system T protein|uniref:aminomethyltransferase n=1 Tax=Chelatococcus composti TaxID=1743235 RepID=A0A841K7U6_9HYPH|nr:glycine cleavage system aminomethyltransferase GcvT [Chelatococcus composti]MBB6168531.1 aminomethyltransferase [Chelatococcus composti]MBS7736390.1 glycine cleavage system aminomethyltransferase GcvT [Chelatococcus composti]PZN44100.1 MAG: glycine cleavage system aminomethyltransferase GcvT [Pseudomonadota bacterium]
MASSPPGSAPLRHTPLHSRHVALGARMVPFAGYDMPVQYAKGIIAEHQHTRKAAGLFDVSHMGQLALVGPDHASVSRALEALVPADILGLVPGQQRYSQLLNDQGGIIDDLMVTRPLDSDDRLLLVVNAACKEGDIRHIRQHLPEGVGLEVLDDRALLALQGPEAEAVLARHAPEARNLSFMTAAPMQVAGSACHVSRSGYTGEDGFEISVPADRAGALWDLLLAEPEVEPVGLGARDSLRLEAGLCLYGHDINEETSPVEAGLAWSIQRRRRQEGGFPGSHRILEELENGPLRRRIGLQPEGRMPAREGTEIKDAAGELVGEVTSGGFAPTLGAPVAMGYVASDFAREGTQLTLVVRGKEIPAQVVPMPFVAHRYKR